MGQNTELLNLELDTCKRWAVRAVRKTELFNKWHLDASSLHEKSKITSFLYDIIPSFGIPKSKKLNLTRLSLKLQGREEFLKPL